MELGILRERNMFISTLAKPRTLSVNLVLHKVRFRIDHFANEQQYSVRSGWARNIEFSFRVYAEVLD